MQNKSTSRNFANKSTNTDARDYEIFLNQQQCICGTCSYPNKERRLNGIASSTNDSDTYNVSKNHKGTKNPSSNRISFKQPSVNDLLDKSSSTTNANNNKTSSCENHNEPSRQKSETRTIDRVPGTNNICPDKFGKSHININHRNQNRQSIMKPVTKNQPAQNSSSIVLSNNKPSICLNFDYRKQLHHQQIACTTSLSNNVAETNINEPSTSVTNDYNPSNIHRNEGTHRKQMLEEQIFKAKYKNGATNLNCNHLHCTKSSASDTFSKASSTSTSNDCNSSINCLGDNNDSNDELINIILEYLAKSSSLRRRVEKITQTDRINNSENTSGLGGIVNGIINGICFRIFFGPSLVETGIAIVDLFLVLPRLFYYLITRLWRYVTHVSSVSIIPISLQSLPATDKQVQTDF